MESEKLSAALRANGAAGCDRDALPERGDCFVSSCPTRDILSHVTGRWGSLVIAALARSGTLRFSELRARIGGISEKMLAQTLRDLERDGLLLRTSRPVVPPHVDYQLTSLGSGVAGHIAELFVYIETHVREVVQAQIEHDSGVAATRGIAAGVTVEPARTSNPSP